jgi:HSP20 family protein
MELMRWRPGGELSRLRKEMDNIWDRFFGEPALTEPTTTWVPSIDVSETDSDIQVRAEVPGLEAKDIDVNVSGDRLSITGEKKREEERRGENYFTHERYFGAFQRMVRLPAEVQVENAEAEFKNGVLNIRIPKSAETKSKRIKIKS